MKEAEKSTMCFDVSRNHDHSMALQHAAKQQQQQFRPFGRPSTGSEYISADRCQSSNAPLDPRDAPRLYSSMKILLQFYGIDTRVQTCVTAISQKKKHKNSVGLLKKEQLLIKLFKISEFFEDHQF